MMSEIISIKHHLPQCEWLQCFHVCDILCLDSRGPCSLHFCSAPTSHYTSVFNILIWVIGYTKFQL